MNRNSHKEAMQMQISGKKMGSVKALRESLKKGGSSLTTFIKNVPAEGITVRFLTEPEEWFGYYEYWNDESRNFCPMAVGEVLPDGARPSFRYLATVVDVESDRVLPIKLAKTAANSLILKYDKYGTMLDRNYELQRHGEGLDTTYDVTPDAPSKLNLGKYEMINLEQVLIDARANALGEKDTEPRKTVVVDDDEIDEEVAMSDDDLYPDDEFRGDYSQEELSFIAKNSAKLKELLGSWELDSKLTGIKAIRAILKAQLEAEDEDGEGASEDESDEDTTPDSYDEDALHAMSLRDLRLIAEDLEIDIKGLNKELLIESIIEASEM